MMYLTHLKLDVGSGRERRSRVHTWS